MRKRFNLALVAGIPVADWRNCADTGWQAHGAGPQTRASGALLSVHRQDLTTLPKLSNQEGDISTSFFVQHVERENSRAQMLPFVSMTKAINSTTTSNFISILFDGLQVGDTL